MISHFSWHSPFAFALLIPLLAVFIFLLFFRRKSGAFLYSDLNLLLKHLFSLRAYLAFLPQLLKGLALLFLILAFARPQSTEQISHQNQDGLDIMIVMDISLSMLVEDMGPSITRLSASKEVVRQFIEGRPHDRMGLIVFSGESFTKTPLTYDHEMLKKQLLEVQTLNLIEGGTAIGVVLANATARLKSSPEKSRSIVFLTDGENNRGFIDPDTALELVKKNNIKVYTVGLGRRSGHFVVKFKDQNRQGQSFYRKARIVSRINKELMQKISQETGGKFFMANSLHSLQQIFNQIDKLETYEIQIDKWTLYNEHFENFLLVALELYFLSVFLSLTVFFRGI